MIIICVTIKNAQGADPPSLPEVVENEPRASRQFGARRDLRLTSGAKTSRRTPPRSMQPRPTPPEPPAPTIQQNAETVSRDDAATVAQETDDPPAAELAATSGTASADKDQESAGEEATVQAEENVEEEEIVCYDATAEFEKWSAALDDNIRDSVLREITAQLEKATANLDRQQARLERLHVETELYRMQIQHLQNRRQEWEPAE